MVGGAKKWKSGPLEVPDSGVGFRSSGKGLDSGSWEGEVRFGAVLDRLGRIPLPPYMRQEAGPPMRTVIQTVFARLPGSVAAPTAGLHLTELIASMEARSLRQGDPARRCWHVQAAVGRRGTHEMHGERCLISRTSLRRLSRHQGPDRGRHHLSSDARKCVLARQPMEGGGPGPEADVAQWMHRDVEPGFSDFPLGHAGWLADRVGRANSNL